MRQRRARHGSPGAESRRPGSAEQCSAERRRDGAVRQARGRALLVLVVRDERQRGAREQQRRQRQQAGRGRAARQRRLRAARRAARRSRARGPHAARAAAGQRRRRRNEGHSDGRRVWLVQDVHVTSESAQLQACVTQLRSSQRDAQRAQARVQKSSVAVHKCQLFRAARPASLAPPLRVFFGATRLGRPTPSRRAIAAPSPPPRRATAARARAPAVAFARASSGCVSPSRGAVARSRRQALRR
jgi:hypothetical protein